MQMSNQPIQLKDSTYLLAVEILKRVDVMLIQYEGLTIIKLFTKLYKIMFYDYSDSRKNHQ